MCVKVQTGSTPNKIDDFEGVVLDTLRDNRILWVADHTEWRSAHLNSDVFALNPGGYSCAFGYTRGPGIPSPATPSIRVHSVLPRPGFIRILLHYAALGAPQVRYEN
jgi:hypothetical protein